MNFQCYDITGGRIKMEWIEAKLDKHDTVLIKVSSIDVIKRTRSISGELISVYIDGKWLELNPENTEKVLSALDLKFSE